MMMTDEWLTILEEADTLAQLLLSSETMSAYRQAHKEVYSDEVLATAIREFIEMKERFEEVQRFGRYHPDYSFVMKEIRERKRVLDMNEKIASLRLAENDVQAILDEISTLLAASVSEAVKVPTGNGFFSSSSCSSGCGSGGSCSCSA